MVLVLEYCQEWLTYDNATRVSPDSYLRGVFAIPALSGPVHYLDLRFKQSFYRQTSWY